jgi:broad specificity phosphatase PhoE
LVTGDKNDPLALSEISRVEELSGWLNKTLNVAIDEYYVSDWCRAQQTANIIYPDAAWKVDPRIGETDAGSAKNLRLDEFLELEPEFYVNNSNHYPDGESHLELNDRVLTWLNEVLGRTDIKNVMVVAHSGPITCILQYVCGVGMEQFPLFLPTNSSISCIESINSESGHSVLRLKFFSASPNLIFK